MAELVVSVRVAAPAAATWAAVTDWEHQGDWMLGTRVETTTQDGRGVGAGLRAFTGVGPLGFWDSMEITGWAPPHRCEVRHTGRLVRGCASFEVQELTPQASRLVWSEWLELPGGLAGQLGFRVLRPAFAGGVALSLRRFARWVPSRAGTSGAAARAGSG